MDIRLSILEYENLIWMWLDIFTTMPRQKSRQMTSAESVMIYEGINPGALIKSIFTTYAKAMIMIIPKNSALNTRNRSSINCTLVRDTYRSELWNIKSQNRTRIILPMIAFQLMTGTKIAAAFQLIKNAADNSIISPESVKNSSVLWNI